MPDGLVLVVEDSDEDVEAIGRALRRTHPDLRLELLRSGVEVMPRLTAADRPRPGLMLLDLNMPGESGLDVLRRVRGAFKDLTIVVFTSSEDQAEADACAAAGADSYIYKPINFALFQTVLGQTLDYWRAHPPS